SSAEAQPGIGLSSSCTGLTHQSPSWLEEVRQCSSTGTGRPLDRCELAPELLRLFVPWAPKEARGFVCSGFGPGVSLRVGPGGLRFQHRSRAGLELDGAFADPMRRGPGRCEVIDSGL